MIDFYSTQGHSKEDYEKSHGARFDFFVKRFGFDKVQGKSILDVGCGLGFMFDRINTYGNRCFGIDYTNQNNIEDLITFIQADLNLPFSEKTNEKFDIIICAETLEHLQNPYNCLYEIKQLMKEDSFLYLSIPSEATTHNTLYPGLFYPVENFEEFLRQMAFEIITHEQHNAAFSQEVFVLKSLSWDNNNQRMKFYKSDDNQRCVPPHVAINL